VRFKQNLPLLLVLLTAAAAAGLWLASAPGDDDLVRRAATEHLKTLPPGASFELHADVADVRFPDGRASFLLFEKRDGAWRYSKDLGKEFAETLQQADVARAVAERLGRRLQERFGGEVVVTGGMDYEYVLLRDPDGLVGRMTVLFAYGGGRRGRYVERFRREHGRWESQGGGALFDSAPTPK
jgi:hypothetical protein